jgi:hypothetical protein
MSSIREETLTSSHRASCRRFVTSSLERVACLPLLDAAEFIAEARHAAGQRQRSTETSSVSFGQYGAFRRVRSTVTRRWYQSSGLECA